MSIPAGWYPDPSGAPGTRWWDGGQCTAHASPVAGYAAVPSAPAKIDVPTSTVWVWLAIAASVLPFFTIFLMDWPGFIDAIAATAATGADSSYLVTWQLNSLLISFVSWGAIALFILFSWFDWRELGRRGIVRPFHWAWAFFGLLSFGVAVYMIGRAVVLGARTVRGSWAPLWVWIAATAACYIAAFAWVFWFFGALFSALGPSMTYN